MNTNREKPDLQSSVTHSKNYISRRAYQSPKEREEERLARMDRIATKRAQLTRNVPKSYPAIDDYGLEIAALKAQEKIQRLRDAVRGHAGEY